MTALVPFIDIESTGLDHNTDAILEVAMLAVTPELEVQHTCEYVVSWPYDISNRAVPFVKEMHDKSGLWKAVADSQMSLQAVEDALFDHYRDWFGSEQLPMFGSSLRLDRAFLERWMPLFHGLFHYRSVDVSTLKELSKIYAPSVAQEWDGISNSANKSHRAVADALSSVEELSFYLASMRNSLWSHPKEIPHVIKW